MEHNEKKQLYTVAEVANLLNRGTGYVRAITKRGLLTRVRIGKRLRYTWEKIQQFLDACTINQPHHKDYED